MWVLKQKDQEIGVMSRDVLILTPVKNADVEIHIERYVGGFPERKGLCAEVIYAPKYNRPIVFTRTLNMSHEIYFCSIGVYKNTGRYDRVVNLLKLYLNL